MLNDISYEVTTGFDSLVRRRTVQPGGEFRLEPGERLLRVWQGGAEVEPDARVYGDSPLDAPEYDEDGGGDDSLLIRDIEAIVLTLTGYQRGMYACRQYGAAATRLEEAVSWLYQRARMRATQGLVGQRGLHVDPLWPGSLPEPMEVVVHDERPRPYIEVERPDGMPA